MDKRLEAIVERRQRNFFKEVHERITSLAMQKWEEDTDPDKPQDFDEKHYYTLKGREIPDYSGTEDAPAYDSNTVYPNRDDYLPDNYSYLSADEQAKALSKANKKAYKQWIIDTYLPEHEKQCNRLKRVQIMQGQIFDGCYTDDAASDYFGYSWDEILGMAEEGASIPDEVLNWAIEMSKTQVAGEEAINDSSDANAFYSALKNSPNANFQTIAKALVKKNEEETKYIEDFLEEIDIAQNEVNSVSQNIKNEKDASLDKINSLQDEYEDVQEKIDSGDELTENELSKFKSVENDLKDEDKNYKNIVKNSTRKFNDYDTKLNEITSKLTEAQGFADVTFDFLSDIGDDYRETTNGSRVQYFSDGYISVFPVLILPYLAQNSALILDDKIQTTAQEKDVTVELMNETAQDTGITIESATAETQSVLPETEKDLLSEQKDNGQETIDNETVSNTDNNPVTTEEQDEFQKEKIENKTEDSSDDFQETAYDADGVHVPEYTKFEIKAGKLKNYETSAPEITQDDDATATSKKFTLQQKDFENKNKKNDEEVYKTEIKISKNTKDFNSSQIRAEKYQAEAEKNIVDTDNQKLSGDTTMASVDAENVQSLTEQSLEGELKAQRINTEVDALSSEIEMKTAEAEESVNEANSNGEKNNAEMKSILSALELDDSALTSVNNELTLENDLAKKENEQEPAESAEDKLQENTNFPYEDFNTAEDDSVQANSSDEAEKSSVKNDFTNNNFTKSQQFLNQNLNDFNSSKIEKIHFASDNQNKSDFVGFVAQSDSMNANMDEAFVPVDNSASLNLQNQPKDLKTDDFSDNQEANTGNNVSNVASANSYKNGQTNTNDNSTASVPAKVNNSQKGNTHYDKINTLQMTAMQYRNRAFSNHLKLIQSKTLTEQQILANIRKAAEAEAAANRAKSVTETKIEEVSTIQKVAQTTSQIGSYTKTAGDSTKLSGKAVAKAGDITVKKGESMLAEAKYEETMALLKETKANEELLMGNEGVSLGLTEESTGGTMTSIGSTTTVAGGTTETVGLTTVGTGLGLIASIITAPLGIVTEAAGWALNAAGITTTAAGVAETGTGLATTTTGIAQQVKGSKDIISGTKNLAEAATEETKAKATEALADALKATGSAQKAYGEGVLIPTGETFATIGTLANETGNATKAISDFVNGNVKEGLTTVANMAASAASFMSSGTPIIDNAGSALSSGANIAGQIAGKIVEPASSSNKDNSDKNNKKKEKTSKQKELEKKRTGRQSYLKTRYSK